MGLIKETLQRHLMGVIEEYDRLIFNKSFIKESRIYLTAVSYEKGDIMEIISLYSRSNFKAFYDRINNSEVLLFLASTLKKSSSFSRDTSHVKLDDAYKLKNDFNKFNEVLKSEPHEVWGETITGKVYSPKVYRIRYGVDGFLLVSSLFCKLHFQDFVKSQVPIFI